MTVATKSHLMHWIPFLDFNSFWSRISQATLYFFKQGVSARKKKTRINSSGQQQKQPNWTSARPSCNHFDNNVLKDSLISVHKLLRLNWHWSSKRTKKKELEQHFHKYIVMNSVLVQCLHQFSFASIVIKFLYLLFAIVNTVIIVVFSDFTLTFIFASHSKWIIYGLPLNVQLINSMRNKKRNADVNKSETE